MSFVCNLAPHQRLKKSVPRASLLQELLALREPNETGAYRSQSASVFLSISGVTYSVGLISPLARSTPRRAGPERRRRRRRAELLESAAAARRDWLRALLWMRLSDTLVTDYHVEIHPRKI